MSYTTKDGKTITMSFTVDSEPERKFNSQWIVHKIVASVDGVDVGYLKISYVPAARMTAMFPSLLNYVMPDYFPEGKKNAPWRELSLEAKQRLVLYAMLGRYAPRHKSWDLDSYGDQDRVNKMPVEEVDHYLALLDNPEINKDGAAKMKKFVDFHVDKPLVDFIRVNEEWQRQGIGLALYRAGAAWLDENYGSHLHASGVQSPEAKGAWQHMDALGWVAATDYGRPVLDPKKIG